MKTTATERREFLFKTLQERILILDGACGTMVQKHQLTEADYRGELFVDSQRDLLNNNDLLVLTQPQIIRSIHAAYTAAGADIITTSTFSATNIAQHEFFHFSETAEHGQEYYEEVLANAELSALTREMNLAACALAREAAQEAEARENRPVLVAGSIGPMAVTASLSPKVTDPGYRAVNFDQLRRAYREQVLALAEGGVDILLL